MFFSVVEIVAVSLFFGDVEMHRRFFGALLITCRTTASRLSLVTNDIFAKINFNFDFFNSDNALRGENFSEENLRFEFWLNVIILFTSEEF